MISLPSEYAVVYEQGPASWGAYVLDLPGCIAAAQSLQECEDLIRDAIVFHLECLEAEGDSIPPATYRVGYVKVA